MDRNMHELRQEYIDTVLSLDGDAKGRERVLDIIAHSDIKAYGSPVAYSFVPYVFGREDVLFLEEVSRRTHDILCKVIDRYIEDADYRDVFRFSKELEELILMPCPYQEKLPMARFDIFLDEADRSYKFCEFNTDGSGAMSRDAEGGRALMESASFKAFSHVHSLTQFNLFDSWVEAFMDTYRSCEGFPAQPVVAITDFKESGVMSDFVRFIDAFKRAGIDARFTDVRTFEYDGEHLIDPADGAVINAIYRRAVTSDILQHEGECEAFLQACEDMNVCVIGHFRSTVVHSKVVSVALFDERTRAFLTREESAFIDEHVPRTYRLDRACPLDMEKVIAEKDDWILKPEDDYGAHGVIAGIDITKEAWREALAASMGKGYIIQEFYVPHLVSLIPVELPADGDAMRVESWHTMPGLYTYNGNFAGVYSREGKEGVIALDHGGVVSPSFKIE